MFVTVAIPQLSAVTGVPRLTVAKQTPGSVLTTIAAGQVIVGSWVSLTVTVKVHVEVRPEASVAVYVTGAVPIGKLDPGRIVAVKVTPEQLSLAVGAVQKTFALQLFGVFDTTIFAGHPVIVGF